MFFHHATIAMVTLMATTLNAFIDLLSNTIYNTLSNTPSNALAHSTASNIDQFRTVFYTAASRHTTMWEYALVYSSTLPHHSSHIVESG
jgi:hypothetical protein